MIDQDDLWRHWPWRSQWQSRGYLLMTIDHVTEEVNDNDRPPAKNVPEKIFTKRIRWPNTNGEPGTPSPSWWIGGLSWLKSSSSSSWSSPTSSSFDHHQVGVGVYYPSGQTTICVDARPLTEPLRPIDVSTGHRQNHHHHMHYYQMHNGHHTIVISWPVPDLCCQVLLYASPRYFAELESKEEEDGACITLFTKWVVVVFVFVVEIGVIFFIQKTEDLTT